MKEAGTRELLVVEGTEGANEDGRGWGYKQYTGLAYQRLEQQRYDREEC